MLIDVPEFVADVLEMELDVLLVKEEPSVLDELELIDIPDVVLSELVVDVLSEVVNEVD